MKHRLPEPVLAELNDMVSIRIGIYFPRNRWSVLERGISAAARELGFSDTRSCIHGLLTSALNRPQLEVLAAYLTVGETYFFREPKSFDAVEQSILKQLIDARRSASRQIRIWSAGCASGEEPYSLAILLHRMLPDIDDWNISILATDINPRLLQKAEQGLYSEWSFRGDPKYIKDGYFKLTSHGQYQIHPRIKQLVTFSYLNLVEDGYPGLTNGTNAMDLIFCRNVIMYFQSSLAKLIVDKFYRCLVDGGCLAVSAVETSHMLFSSYNQVKHQEVVLYMKTEPAQWIPAVTTTIPADFDTVSPNDDRASRTPATAAEGFAGLSPPRPSIINDDVKSSAAAPEGSPYEKAVEMFQAGYYHEAEMITAAHLADHSDDERTQLLMTRILANQGRLTEALAWCKQALITNKTNGITYYLLGTIQQECNQLNDAVISLRRALYLDPGLVLAHFTLGNIARSQGKAMEAAKHFDNARLLLDKDNPEHVIPESEGISCHRLLEIIQAIGTGQEAA